MNSYLPFTASTAVVDGVDLVSGLFVLRGAEGRVRVSEAAVEDVTGVSGAYVAAAWIRVYGCPICRTLTCNQNMRDGERPSGFIVVVADKVACHIR